MQREGRRELKKPQPHGESFAAGRNDKKNDKKIER